MRRVLIAGLFVLSASVLLRQGYGGQVSAQEPVIQRSKPMTMTGELVDMSCYKAKGVAGGTGAAHADCAKICILEKGAVMGILTDGDGVFKIWGATTKDKYAKLMPYLGQQVEVTGTEVTLSNNYDARSFDLQTVKRRGK